MLVLIGLMALFLCCFSIDGKIALLVLLSILIDVLVFVRKILIGF